ncbi:hypothetical protein L1987_32795 [Smallanthus sonchifolius]|uniref:Uncharacterized protein n=1 Tax=Smallanthus sonchifolius TaxID=185202 RepID=A0ACB9HPJ5_9ASTR|nr:hypothetical protein L1987_32795 [Smallanthus sonchifolius]
MQPSNPKRLKNGSVVMAMARAKNLGKMVATGKNKRYKGRVDWRRLCDDILIAAAINLGCVLSLMGRLDPSGPISIHTSSF